MVNVFNQGIGMQVPFTDNPIGRVVPFSAGGAREFLPQISPEEMEKIKKELHGMIGRRIILTNDELEQIRRAINMLLEDPNAVLRNAMASHRLVAVLSSEPACGAPVISALREGGATHLAMNLPKIFQPALDHYQATGNKAVLNEMLKHRGFKHPLPMLETAVMCGVKLVAVGDQQMYEGDRRTASIESIAIDVSNLLDQSPRSRVVLWASDHYVRRTHDPKICLSSTDYLALNHKIFTVHNGNYLVDGGPLRKIVFDLQCPGALTTGKNRLIDGLSTGVEDSLYRDWDAILLQPQPLKDHSYFLTND
jgi:hypothetical protein